MNKSNGNMYEFVSGTWNPESPGWDYHGPPAHGLSKQFREQKIQKHTGGLQNAE